MRRGVLLRAAGSIALTAGCAAFVLTRLDLDDLAAAIGDIRPFPVVLILACHLALVVLRAARVGDQLVGGPAREVLAATSLYHFLAAVMPMRSGELSLPLILRTRLGVTLTQGVLLLLRIRLFDLVLCVSLGLTAIAFVPAAGAFYGAWWAGPAGVSLLVAAAAMSARMEDAERLARNTARRLGLLRFVGEEPEPLGAPPARTGRRLFAWTAAIWIVVFVGYGACANAAGLSVGLAELGVASAAASLVFALPVNGIGSYGPSQIAFAATLSSFGHPFDAALVASLLMQTMSLMVLGIAASLTLLVLPVMRESGAVPSDALGPERRDGVP